MRNTLIILSTVFLLQGCLEEDEEPRDYVEYTTPTVNVVSSSYKADTTCDKSDPSCNVCATDVQRQFHDAVDGKLSWKTNSWTFDWEQSYEPDNATPKSIFGSPVEGFLGFYASVNHVQGFVRTNSDLYPYSGSHSHTTQGGIFVVKNTDNGLELASLHKSEGNHPSGVHVLGNYLVYGDGSQLVFKDLNSSNHEEDINLNISAAKFGGGLGFAKLVNGSYLAITTGPGGESNLDKRDQFYDLEFQNDEPSSLTYLNDSKVTLPSDWPRQDRYILSENLSVITECGTGDIYTVNVSGSTNEGLFGGYGFWRLSKLESQDDEFKLSAVNYYQNDQNISTCTPRASGTVSVDANNKLEFYCHEHGKDESKVATKYSFKKGSF